MSHGYLLETIAFLVVIWAARQTDKLSELRRQVAALRVELEKHISSDLDDGK